LTVTRFYEREAHTLVTLRDAALYITKLPKAEHDAEAAGLAAPSSFANDRSR
jgi:hypothetical protein